MRRDGGGPLRTFPHVGMDLEKGAHQDAAASPRRRSRWFAGARRPPWAWRPPPAAAGPRRCACGPGGVRRRAGRQLPPPGSHSKSTCACRRAGARRRTPLVAPPECSAALLCCWAALRSRVALPVAPVPLQPMSGREAAGPQRSAVGQHLCAHCCCCSAPWHAQRLGGPPAAASPTGRCGAPRQVASAVWWPRARLHMAPGPAVTRAGPQHAPSLSAAAPLTHTGSLGARGARLACRALPSVARPCAAGRQEEGRSRRCAPVQRSSATRTQSPRHAPHAHATRTHTAEAQRSRSVASAASSAQREEAALAGTQPQWRSSRCTSCGRSSRCCRSCPRPRGEWEVSRTALREPERRSPIQRAGDGEAQQDRVPTRARGSLSRQRGAPAGAPHTLGSICSASALEAMCFAISQRARRARRGNGAAVRARSPWSRGALLVNPGVLAPLAGVCLAILAGA